MILYWLRLLVRAIAKLFVSVPSAHLAVIDVHEKCPACGHRNGRLRSIGASVNKEESVSIEHTCQICGARWYSETVVQSKHIYPAA